VDAAELIAELRSLGNPANLAGMSRYGIRTDRALGVGIPALRGLARRAGRDHALAAWLWETGIHEARILASMVDVPGMVTGEQMDAWVLGFDSWDLCDQVCSNLFSRTSHAWARALAWSTRSEEFVKRAGFALMAALTVHDRAASDDAFQPFLAAIERGSDDNRNYVRKAVSWALRQIGKRGPKLRARAVDTAFRIRARGTPAARWIAGDALRELTRARPAPRDRDPEPDGQPGRRPSGSGHSRP